MRTDAAPLGWGWTVRAGVGLVGLVLAFSSTMPRLRAQSGVVGEWRTLGRLMPINPVHAALMNNGKVLIVSGSGNVAAETNFRSAVYDPVADTLDVINSQPWDMFCNGMVVLSDGRVFVNGGNRKYDPFWGWNKNAVFDPAAGAFGAFTDVQTMAHGRWYPTVTTLGDGRVMTFSGLDETSATNTSVEIYTPGVGWSQEYARGSWTPPLYPRMHLLPNGNVLYSGSGTGSRVFDTTAKTWSAVVATTNSTTTRSYGTSVLLPLRASDSYKAKVMILGGGNPSIATTEILDASVAVTSYRWTSGPSMSQPRIEMNATLLPNGKVLATGGSGRDEDTTTASLNADLYDPISNTFSSAGRNVYPRVYHSNALLLPDATVLLLGGNPARGTYEQHMEIYSPAYLFATDVNGNPIPRPTITTNPGSISYGAPFQIPTGDDPTNITSVVLVRPGTPTHAFDMEQRLVELPFSTAGGLLTATAPPNGNIAPPGYYMLFILNSAGVPSVASFVRLSSAPANQAPTASIDSPASNITVNPGDAVAFSGGGTDSDGNIVSYAWTFAGGSPASSTGATPSVTYSTPGTYQASLTVTDNGGLTSAAATRTITVSDFSVTATPSTRSLTPGGSAGYTATVAAVSGFTGTVALSVTGLPAGATATFVPTSIATSGSSALTVVTSATTPAGSYTLTIRGTSGPVSRTVNVTLVVANQSPTASINSPASNITVNPGDAVAFSGGGTDPDGNVVSYAWTFPGGSPASSSSTTPSVTYSTPGTYQASLTVTDDAGLTSAAATRTITVSDFSVSATPSSNSPVQGGTAGYTATVGAVAGFTGSVALSVTGLPAGTSATFSPPTINSSGSSALSVFTSASTPAGTYTLTIRGTSGPLSRAVNVTLNVTAAGNFTILATPTSRTVQNGNNAIYTITIGSVGGFNSAVSLSVDGLPKFVGATFSPATMTPGNSTLTLTTKKQTKNGTSTVTITATSGALSQSTTVTLVVQ